MLNKITGWDSRTVPPLYVMRVLLSTKVGHWIHSGKAEGHAGDAASIVTSQKTYRKDSPFACAIMGKVLVAEKRLRHLYSVPQPYCF